MGPLRAIWFALRGDPEADRVVPPGGATVWLTVTATALMAFLSVLTLFFAVSAARVADTWSGALDGVVTVLIDTSEKTDGGMGLTDKTLTLLLETPGVAEARAIDLAETRRLLAPWFGEDIPLADLPVPQLIEVTEAPEGLDLPALRARLAAEVPQASIEDHGRWRAPLVEAARGLFRVVVAGIAAISVLVAITVTLAARVALATNAATIAVLRLVGARDAYIARAFVRRFTLRSLTGAVIGTAVGAGAVLILPADAGFGPMGFLGAQWLALVILPLILGLIGFAATRAAALRQLRALT